MMGAINHLIFSSEAIEGDNVWQEMKPGDMIGVDWRMRMVRGRVGAATV